MCVCVERKEIQIPIQGKTPSSACGRKRDLRREGKGGGGGVVSVISASVFMAYGRIICQAAGDGCSR